VVETGRMPLSNAAAAALSRQPELMTRVLTGGDDYEILFTAPAASLDAVADLSRRLDLPLTVIGRMTAGSGVRVIGADGSEIALESSGFRHF
jgi:thiamine-monophosphate kinase